MDRKAAIVNQLVKFKKSISKDFPLEKMIFFGSRATGRPHRWSDIDLILVSSKFENMDFFQRGASMYDYWKLDYPVDFLCYAPKEFKEKSKQITIVSEAINEGIEIK